MRILINGATAGTNFGDYLFAEMYQRCIAERIGFENLAWYDSRYSYSDFFKKHLKNTNRFRLRDINALICMPGGYFCGQGTKLKNYVIVYLMYFRIGLKCLRKKIPYAIFGMEVGHSKNKIIEKIQKKLLVNAEFVCVRNNESYAVAKEYGVENLYCSADNVFAMSTEIFKDKEIPKEIQEYNRKKIFLHINPRPGSNNQIKEKIIPIINKFTEEHSEYDVLISADQYCPENKEELDSIAKLIKSQKVLQYHYNDPLALCKVIDCCDVVVTTKLHVGIVGAKFGKSVISFSGHTEKIKRLYAQLGESGRTIPLETLTMEKGLEIMNNFHNKPIVVPNEIIEKANLNFELLNKFLNKIKNENK